MFRPALLAAALTALPLTALAQAHGIPPIVITTDANDGKVSVSGEGQVVVSPDRVRAVFSADARSADRQTASETARKLAADIRAAALDAGVPEAKLRTLNTTLGPVYDYGNGNGVPKIAGYAGTVSLEITVDDPEVAGAAIDAAIKAGATRITGPFFEVSDPKAAQAEARSLAMKDAVERARTLAEAGGFAVGEVVSVTDQTSSPQSYAPMMMMRAEMAVADAAPATQIDTGEQTITANVSAVFRIVPDFPEDAGTTSED